MDLQRVMSVHENDDRRTTIRYLTTKNLLEGYEDLGVSLLENGPGAKRCRYLNPNSMVWPMGYGLVTSLYKYRNKKPTKTPNINFDRLPEEIILHIFKMLDKRTLIKCAYVCSKWRRITYDESLWQCLNIPHRRMSIMTLDNLLRRNIKFLSISHANIYVDTEYSFKTSFTKLKYLDMGTVFIPVEDLSSLLSQCRNLVKLSLENCILDHACCESIGLNTNLKVLNLASTIGLNCIGLKHIISLRNLEELNVSWSDMEYDDLHYLAANLMPSIKRLNISGFLKKLVDFDLISMVCRCPHLIELDISDNLAITSNSLDFVLNNQLSLKVLSMSRCYNIGSAFLHPTSLKMKIGNGVHGLRELNVFGIGNQLAFNMLCALLFNFDINKNIYSSIARPKLADKEDTIWEIPTCINC